MPDRTHQFIVEMDASDAGVGAVLSQRSGKDNKIHPCERNYAVGDRELLVVKTALEEWRHWLEGAELPFVVWTDHKNLEYLKKAKRLNPRQARWALFFSRFNFSLSYRPGAKNVEPDILSRLHTPESNPESDSTILPAACFVGAITWEVEAKVRVANGANPPPSGCPPNRLYVPPEL